MFILSLKNNGIFSLVHGINLMCELYISKLNIPNVKCFSLYKGSNNTLTKIR